MYRTGKWRRQLRKEKSKITIRQYPRYFRFIASNTGVFAGDAQ